MPEASASQTSTQPPPIAYREVGAPRALGELTTDACHVLSNAYRELSVLMLDELHQRKHDALGRARTSIAMAIAQLHAVKRGIDLTYPAESSHSMLDGQ